MNLGGRIRVSHACLALLALAGVALLYVGLGNGSLPFAQRKLVGSRKVSLKALLVASIEMAKRGGREVKNVREQANIGEKSKGKTREGANNPVTDGDMLSHRQMYYGFKKAFPEVNVISEEDDPEALDMSKVAVTSSHDPEVDSVVPLATDSLVPIDDVDVWIDPLDATQEYTENLLRYVTTMVCVAVKGRPTIGVIHKPFVDGATAWAWAGPNYVSEAVREEQKLQGGVHGRRDLSRTRIVVSRSHKGSVHEVAEKAFGAGADVEGAGGAGYKAWEVAKGSKDVYVHTSLIKKWDICAGAALLNALGGKLTALDGKDIDYSGRPAEVKNEGGVLATMHDHGSYVEALKSVGR